jgi:allophanate hydrolase subunit 1
MIGFLPGFAYMGTVHERIATARKTNPRTLVHAGSVGIAGKQTGIYPFDSPGGWNIIGQTPLRMFDAHRKDPVLLNAGDEVRFVPVTFGISATQIREMSLRIAKSGALDIIRIWEGMVFNISASSGWTDTIARR